jgi:hypothetical protein
MRRRYNPFKNWSPILFSNTFCAQKVGFFPGFFSFLSIGVASENYSLRVSPYEHYELHQSNQKKTEIGFIFVEKSTDHRTTNLCCRCRTSIFPGFSNLRGPRTVGRTVLKFEVYRSIYWYNIYTV